ncbi:uncharacterized protein LOC6740095 isoform X2 [Drosophila simulans]|uniref:uncharacterized protein LOC6740095 isoform X2 n=1 Tax=Drosophila simulans TaxID=7240 RepID=UPI00078AEFF4|nr:uncharacterized protein LOC6740095 isoform X2 [Drosophila simulans]KMZ09504.1 uncharacterized protein Dsimw501_GD24799, isoform C [Drosophila simulans]
MSHMGAISLYDEPEIMEEFISCYQFFTALWDSSSPDYLSKQKKEPGYQELLKILRRVNGNCSIQDVKRKINSLRCCYRREFKKVQESVNGYQTRLWWFHLMDFLKPVLNIQSPARVKSENVDDSLDETSIQDVDIMSDTFNHEEDMLRIDAVGDGDVEPEAEPDNDPELDNMEDHVEDYRNNSSAGSITVSSHLQHNGESQTSDKSGRRIRSRSRRSRSSNDTDYVDTARKRRNVETSNRDRDWNREREGKHESDSEYECELMGKRVASHFRRMRPDQRLFAERIISEVLVYGRLNRLSFEAQFSLGQK